MDEYEIKKLKLLIFNKSKVISHIHVFGENGNGRSEILRQLLRENHEDSWVIASVDFLYADGSLRLLLESMANQLMVKIKSSRIEDFFANLPESVDWPNPEKKQLILFFDNVQSVTKFNPAIMRCLFLSYKAVENVTIRFVTSGLSCWETYQSNISLGHLPVAQVHIKTPSKERAIQLISNSCPFMNVQFIKFAVDTLYQHCKIPNLLLSVITRAYSIYDESEMFDRQKASDCLKTVAETKLGIGNGLNITKINSTIDNFSTMPLSMRYLLIASYCASNNAPSTDRRFFVKNHGRDKRSEKKELKAEMSRQLKDIEPKSADLQRIICIYQVLVAWNYDGSLNGFDLKNVISSLNSMGLIKITSLVNLDDPKIKCLISLESAHKIAESLNIQLRNYVEYPN